MIRTFVHSLMLLLFLMLLAPPAISAENAQKTFVVHCYDVGIAVLKDKPGVVDVKRTWRDLEETNIVIYDPEQIDVDQLESWLRESGTYIRTLSEPATL